MTRKVRKRDLVGRKIVGVEMKRIYEEAIKTWQTDLVSMTLDNGRKILFHAAQIYDDEYCYVTPIHATQRKK